MSEWIKCSDRLPTIGIIVLCCKLGKTPLSTDIFLGALTIHEEWLHSGKRTDNVSYDVTHWMPLPEPPKEEL